MKYYLMFLLSFIFTGCAGCYVVMDFQTASGIIAFGGLAVLLVAWFIYRKAKNVFKKDDK